MPLRDWLAALLVVTAWGASFVMTKLALNEISPLVLGGLRFTLVAFPAIFFIPRPVLPLKTITLYGLTIGLGQFAFLFTAIHMGMPAGLASLVAQAQAFFTVLIAALIMREPVRLHNMLGLVIAVAGLAMIYQTAVPGTVPFVGLMLTLMGALCWALGNIVVKVTGKTDMLSLVVWSALIPPIPYFVLSWLIEGPQALPQSIQNMTYVSVLTIFYLAFLGTIFGFVLWGRLLNRHPVSTVAPLSLMVPVIGMMSAALFLREQLVFLQWVGGAVVIVGLAINTFGLRPWQHMHILRQTRR